MILTDTITWKARWGSGIKQPQEERMKKASSKRGA